ncbi:MAG TPA: carboxypeptidase-like regulatory domain-containing protein, partial [Bryobacteraceae bacterium]|nr:carboxypeptidase-like regulatory domain-containing protein [Bryobacteraceae bacterium]
MAARRLNSLFTNRTWLEGLVLFLALTPPGLFAQATFGGLTGTVTDTSGAVIPRIPITVTNQATGITKTAETNDHGDYEVTHLNAGTYSVSAEAPGFRKFEHRDILLMALQTVRIDLKLEVGTVGSEITVQTGAPVIETEAPVISNVKTAKELRDLPLNIMNGVVLNAMLFTVPTAYQTQGAKYAMGGARGTQLYYNIDGISANSPAFGVQSSPLEPSIESMGEMTFNVANNKAEFGEVTNVTVITKSGGNKFHGRLYEQNSNTAFNARPFFAITRAQNNSNDFGGSIGGPIRHNRTFFFGAFEGFRQRVPANLAPSVPTVKMRQGDFSDLLRGSNPVTIRNPLSGNQPFPNNVIPTNLLSAASLKWQDRFFPLPNFGAPDLTVSNFRGSYPQDVRQDQFDARVDHYISSKNTAYMRYSYKRLRPHMIDSGVPPDFAGYRVNVRTGHLVALSDTWTLRPNLINEFKLGFSRSYNPREGEITGQEVIDMLGVQGLPRQTEPINNIPSVSISNFVSIFQVAKQAPAENSFQAINQVSWIKGQHTVKMGGEYRPQQYNDYIYPSFGSYSFTNRFSGYSYSDFLLGLPQSTSRTYVRPPQSARFWFLSGFVQDDYKVSQRLTLSYGVRYEYDPPGVDTHDTIANFDRATGSIVVPNETVRRDSVNPLFPAGIPIITAKQAYVPERSLRRGDRNNLQPRIGFALRPRADTRTVVRGGYGIYSDDFTGDLFSQLYGGPFRITESFNNTVDNNVPLLTFQRAFLPQGTLGALTLTGIDPNLKNPFVQQWNFTLEQALPASLGARVSYIGTLSNHLVYGRNINQPPPSTLPFAQSRRPYPLYQNITWRENGATQNYHAMTAELNRRMNKGLLFNLAWTWAKNLNDADEVGTTEGGPTLENAYDRERERGNSPFVPRHRVVSSLVWELPAGKGRHFLNHGGLANTLIGGWQMTAFYSAQSGLFFTPAFSGPDTSNTQAFGST